MNATNFITNPFAQRPTLPYFFYTYREELQRRNYERHIAPLKLRLTNSLIVDMVNNMHTYS